MGREFEGELMSKAPGATPKDVRLVETLSQGTPEIRPRRRRNIDLAHRYERGRFEGACDSEGELHSEPYAATYVFVK